jgi:MscS family membrane protein
MESIFIYAIAVAAQDSTSAWDKALGFFEAREATLVPIGVVLVIALVLNIIQAIAMRTWSTRMKLKGFRWTSGVAKCLSVPLGWAIWVIGVTIALQIFIEPDAQERATNLVVERVGQIRMGFILLLGGWFMGRLVRYFERMLGDVANESDNVDLTIVRALGNFMVIGVWLLVLLVALQTYGVNMAAIITIGGAGGFALTFAFQDVFKNFFGGIMILLSRPFKIGEGIQVSSVTGTVEKIGMYQTTVRGWDGVPFILPNSMFLTNPIVNFGKRAQRRYQFDLGLRYEDFARVEPVVKGIETFLDAHPLIDPHRAHRVYFSLYGDSSLNISVTCYAMSDTGDTSWYKLQQEVMLGIGNIVSEHGADFAFPTTTIDYPGAPVVPAK